MKREFRFSIMKQVVIFLLSILYFSSKAQTPRPPQTKPYMWVKKKVGNRQVRKFNNTKLPSISKKYGKTLNNNFYLGNFWGMINYFEKKYPSFSHLHVYIGICSGQLPIPNGLENKLVFIFAPSNGTSIGSNLGFFILPTAFDEGNIPNFSITEAQKKEWTGNYFNNMPLETIDANDTDNEYDYPDGHKSLSETICVTYCVKDIEKLRDTKDYYIANGFSISNNLEGYLGAYSKKGNTKGHFKKRIMTEFQFLDKNGNPFYLDDIPGFLNLPAAAETNLCGDNKSFADNGQLCPTYCQ